MKKIALLILTAITLSTFSQTEKGKFYIGVNSNLNFTSTSTKTENNGATFESPTTNQFVISPEVGYFVIDNLTAGLNILLSFSNTENQFGNDQSNDYYIISPFVKYYFLENQFKPFLNARYGFGSMSNEGAFIINNGSVPQTFQLDDTSIRNLVLGGGLAYFVNNNIAIELNINYINQEFTTENSFDSSKFISTTSGVQTLVGFSILL